MDLNSILLFFFLFSFLPASCTAALEVIELASYLPTFLLHTQAKAVRVCKNDLVQAGGVDHQLVVIGVWSSQEINKKELQALL
jgi:hypothetical protein